MKVITDAKPVRRVFIILPQIDGKDFDLIDDTGDVVRSDASPRRLGDYALENGADDVRHGYDIVAYEGRR